MRILLGLTLSLLISVNAARASAPMCSRVLIPQRFTSENIAATISSIAQFRMELDILKASRTQSVSLESLYRTKFRELVKELSGVYSEKEIKVRISQEIARLQTKSDTEKTSEKQTRKAQEHLSEADLYRKPYKIKDRFPIDRELNSPDRDSYKDSLQYVAKEDALLMVTTNKEASINDTTISLFNLKTQANTVLWQSGDSKLVETKFSSTRNHFAAIMTGKNLTGEIFFYDIENTTSRLLQLPVEVGYHAGKNNILALDITPSGKQILLVVSSSSGPDKKAYLIDSTTGKATLNPALSETARNKWGTWNTQFITETEFLIVQDYKLGSYDLALNKDNPNILEGFLVHSFIVTPELNQVLATPSYLGLGVNSGLFAFTRGSTATGSKYIMTDHQLKETIAIMKPLSEGGVFMSKKFVEQPEQIMISWPDVALEQGAILADPKAKSDFGDITIDKAGRRIFIYTKHESETGAFIEVWEQEK